MTGTDPRDATRIELLRLAASTGLAHQRIVGVRKGDLTGTASPLDLCHWWEVVAWPDGRYSYVRLEDDEVMAGGLGNVERTTPWNSNGREEARQRWREAAGTGRKRSASMAYTLDDPADGRELREWLYVRDGAV
jgi:hypothetical protein